MYGSRWKNSDGGIQMEEIRWREESFFQIAVLMLRRDAGKGIRSRVIKESMPFFLRQWRFSVGGYTGNFAIFWSWSSVDGAWEWHSLECERLKVGCRFVCDVLTEHIFWWVVASREVPVTLVQLKRSWGVSLWSWGFWWWRPVRMSKGRDGMLISLLWKWVVLTGWLKGWRDLGKVPRWWFWVDSGILRDEF